ncbi:MAG: ATP-binding cassette domain-containing protein [Phycisphaerales bacterium]|nr:ATP-binding cassette domain-containing protein [Phycisphaerales bacterium]
MSDTSSLAVAMTGVRKTFGSKVAVEGIDLAIPLGSIYGFIGPNGAGKTTTIRMIMSILFPDCGELSVLGKKSAIESKDQIGYLPEERGIYKKMKVGAFLKYIGRLKGLDSRGLDQVVKGWLERIELEDVYKKKCEELSKGMQQKVQFIAAVLHNPDLIILDEPFSGLDPVNMRLLRKLIDEEHSAGKTVIFSTHVMYQAEQLCDHIVMIHEGKKVLDDTLDDIRTRFDPRALHVDPVGGLGMTKEIAQVSGVAHVNAVEGALEVILEEGIEPQTAMMTLLAAYPMNRIEIKKPTLEDVFIEIVTGGKQGSDAEQLRAELLAGSTQDEEGADS